MKTAKQIDDARKKLRDRAQTPGLTQVQLSCAMGMLNALVWAADGPASATMERMLSDEPMAPGQDHSEPFERLKSGLEAIKKVELETVAEALSQAAVEILNLTDQKNPVYQRVRQAERLVQEHQSKE